MIFSKDVLPEGYKLHWYDIKSILGRGGFGITYLALDENLDQLVAIKEYLPTDISSRNSDQTVHPTTGEKHQLYFWGLKQFLKEARVLAKFKHPNIVRVLSVFEKNNTAYMVMEFEQGKDLSVIFKEKNSFKEEELINLFIPIIDGLTLVHDSGFIHRDIKPANIFIRDADDKAVLIDFGSARLATEEKTQALTSLITFGYTPFEQYHEGTNKQGPWTDIYSLGATLYYLIVGHLPQDALRRGSDLFDGGVDSYKPLSQIAAGKYSHNFLLAIDNALMFRTQDRPENLSIWRAILQGEIAPKPLLENMTMHLGSDINEISDISDRTVIMPSHKKRGSQDHSLSYHRVENSHVSSTPITKKPWFLTAITISIATIIGAGVLTLFLAESTPPSPPPQQISQKQEKADYDNELAEQAQQIALLIQQAEESFFAGRMIQPLESSATYLYQKVLALSPSNQDAIAGINNILIHYSTLTEESISKQKEGEAEKYIQIIEAIKPSSEIANDMRLKLKNTKQTQLDLAKEIKSESSKKPAEKQLEQISSLLAEAERYYSTYKISMPTGKNAFNSYYKALKLDPSNEKAQQGIKKIIGFYELKINKHITNNNLIRASQTTHVLERVAPNSPVTKQLRTRIEKAIKQKAQTKMIALQPVIPSRQGIEAVSELVGEFKKYLEARNSAALNKISEMSSARQYFLKTFFSQYQSFTVEISGFEYIDKKSRGSASVSLTQLENIEGEAVQSRAWDQFDIIIKMDANDQWKVYW